MNVTYIQKELYIPFWLNLYAMTTDEARAVTPLHSILVKSILYKYGVSALRQ